MPGGSAVLSNISRLLSRLLSLWQTDGVIRDKTVVFCCSVPNAKLLQKEREKIVFVSKK